MTQEPEPGVEDRLTKPGAVTYIRVPAPDPRASGDFYAAVFGWNIRGSVEHLGFDDAKGNVSGAFVRHLAVARDPGLLPYIYVADIDATLAAITARGAEIVTPRYDEGNLWVATFRDPAGNVIGVWQQQPG